MQGLSAWTDTSPHGPWHRQWVAMVTEVQQTSRLHEWMLLDLLRVGPGRPAQTDRRSPPCGGMPSC